MALLAGDALQAEAFGVLGQGYRQDPEIGLSLVRLLTEAIGIKGMVGGQAIDIRAKDKKLDREMLLRMHAMKTGALIRLACEGAAVALGLPFEKQKLIRNFGEEIGLAFQLADDLLDSSPQNLEPGSFPELVGWSATQKMLAEVTERAVQILIQLGIEKGPLHELVRFNVERKI